MNFMRFFLNLICVAGAIWHSSYVVADWGYIGCHTLPKTPVNRHMAFRPSSVVIDCSDGKIPVDSWVYEYGVATGGCVAPQVWDFASYRCIVPSHSSNAGGGGGSGNCPKAFAGNPLLISNGNKFQRESDYSGSKPFPLNINRYYNSQLGEWRFSYSDRLYFSHNDIHYVRADGQSRWFILDAERWKVAIDPELDLQQEADESWTLTSTDKKTYRFDSSGRLVKVINRQGISHSLAYGADSHLQTVTHSLGGQLTFVIDNDKVLEITSPAGGRYQYDYDGVGGLLKTVLLPGLQNPRTYHYEDERFSNYLTGITDANGVRYSTWSYDDQGRAISSEHAGGIDRTDLTFNADGSTTVTNSLGKNTTYHFKQFHSVDKLVLVEGHASSNCAAANKAYGYDADGVLISKTDWAGNTTSYERDERGRIVVRTEAAGTPQERIITTEWHPSLSLPITKTEPERVTRFSYDAEGRLLNKTVSPR